MRLLLKHPLEVCYANATDYYDSLLDSMLGLDNTVSMPKNPLGDQVVLPILPLENN